LVEHAEREERAHSRIVKRRIKEHQDEVTNQEQTGIVKKPTSLGRFKYKQRKEDF